MTSKKTFGQVLKPLNKQYNAIKLNKKSNTTTKGAKVSKTSSFKEMLASLHKVKPQHANVLPPMTDFVPTQRHPPSLIHLKEVIEESQRAHIGLWSAERQFEWVQAKSQPHPRLLEQNTFFWSQKDTKIGWWQLIELSCSHQLIKGSYYSLQTPTGHIKAVYNKGIFKSQNQTYKLESIAHIIGSDIHVFKKLQDKLHKNNQYAVCKDSQGHIIYIDSLYKGEQKQELGS